MTKRMTSKKREFSLSDTPIRKLKHGTKVRKVSSAKRLKDQDLVFKAFWQCLVEQDIESFKEILRGHLEAVNKEQFAKEIKDIQTNITSNPVTRRESNSEEYLKRHSCIVWITATGGHWK